jgi:hypothetical protein
VSSFLVLFWVDIYPIPNSGVLQRVGWITLSRLVELFGCVFLALFIHNVLTINTVKFDKVFLRTVDYFMLLFFVFFAIMYVANIIGFENKFVHGNYRLRGGFVEGGPFGLLVAYYIFLRVYLFGIDKRKSIFMILLTLMAKSKASIFFIFSVLVYHQFLSRNIKFKNIILSVFLGSMLLFFAERYYSFSDRMMDYVYSYQFAEELVETKGGDYNFSAGRMAGFHILPTMVRDNFLLGVGLGNYPLTRNNPKYLGFFPTVPIWDIHGFGGVFTILSELGIVGLLLFFRPFVILFKCSKQRVVKWMVGLFILVQLFGVPTHFQYLWFLVGLMTAIDSKPEIIRSICRRE